MFPLRAIFVGVVFLAREIELTNARGSDLTYNDPTMEVTWFLPASKTDPQARGVSRTLGCLCGVDGFPCPLHVARDHLLWLTAAASRRGPDLSEVPLFPPAA